MKLVIVTVTFNDPEGLSETLASLDALKVSVALPFHWQVVVVDSSPPKNLKVLEKYSNLPIKHIEAEPKGVYAAFNAGVEHAEGDFIWFLNGGDRLNDGPLLKEMLNHLALNSHTDLTFSGVRLTREGQFLYGKFPQKNFLKNLVGGNRVCHQSMIYRLSSFKKVGPFSLKYKIAGDYLHHFRCFIEHFKCEYFEGELVTHDMGGLSNQYDLALKEFRQVQKELRPQLPPAINWANRVVAPLEEWRIRSFKSLKKTRLEKILSNVWLIWNRSKKTRFKERSP